MPAQITLYDSDGTTPLTSVTLTSIAIPFGYKLSDVLGNWKKLYYKNTGDTYFSNVVVDILQSGSDVAYNYAKIAPDLSGAPNVGSAVGPGAGGLNLGSLAVNASTPIWLNIEVPTSATAGVHIFRLFALASL